MPVTRKRKMTDEEREAILEECQRLKAAGVPRREWGQKLKASPRLQIDWKAIDWAAILKWILVFFGL